jgi:diguanylate cyclase (GGDEF)-like protein/PAS domain S-box-containing protein
MRWSNPRRRALVEPMMRPDRLGSRTLRRLAALCLFAWLTLCVQHAGAVESVRVPVDADAIDLTGAVEHFGAQGDRIQVSTAPGPDGIVRRIEVSALEAGARPAWIVFALTNDSDEQLTRLVVAPHFRFVGSGIIWPDLGSARITTITASQGNAPERDDALDADVFRLTLDPGTTVTYVAELRTPSLPQLYLWEPDAYKDNGASLTLYQGILIGIAGLLALFLTIVFVVRGALVFPAAAALAWAVFAYVCIDFGFWRKIFAFDDDSERIWRAGVEATIGATLIIFLFAYLNLRRWHVRFLHIGMVWLLLMTIVVGLSVYNAPIAAGVARISIASVAGIGLLLILSLAVSGSDRAVMLIPTWFLLVVWVFAAGATAMGQITNDLASPGLIGGLVLIVMLIGFTIMQSAFSGGGTLRAGGADAERRALAMTGCGDAIFDWNVGADQIYVSSELESQLGLKRGTLEGPAASWLDVLHPLDRDRYVAALDGLLHQRSGRIQHDIRLRGADGRYSWFLLKARPVIGAQGEVVRVIGALSDVTESKEAEERILHDAIHDNLTGLPNRELFFDRLETALIQARRPGSPRPMVVVIDIDRLQAVNDSMGMSFGDSALLTVARRAARDLKPGDTLARLGGDQFGAIIMIEGDAERASALGEALRAQLASPISFGDREVSLTASLGVSLYEPGLHAKGADLFGDADIALANAKKAGGDRAVLFAREMRSARESRGGLANELRQALQRGEILVLFEPIVRLEDRTVAGFEVSPRWRHPRLGMLGLAEFLSAAESSGVLADIGSLTLEATARELAAWQRALEVTPPIFASLSISSRQILGQDLLADLRAALNRHNVLRGTLKLELTESLVMENPEYAAQLLPRAHDIGAGLALDNFGAGYTSLSHLERYHFDTLKIDSALARPNGTGGRPLILRSVVSMAHDLGMDVIVDGAETESDAVEFSQIGCEFAQGIAFGKPMTAQQARKLMGATAE